MWNHWVALARTPEEPFSDFNVARCAWFRLSKAFPEMLAAVLMPNHLHLILPATTLRVHQKLGAILGGVSKQLKLQQLWQPISTPAEIPDRYHLRRQVRYVALNPCRKSLCADPLEWIWSSYRDVMGAGVGREDFAPRLRQALKYPERDFRVRFHHYVSGDPSVHVNGTIAPTPAVPTLWSDRSLGEILAASAAALRLQPSQVRKKGPLRHLFIHLAHLYGWRRTDLLSQVCAISTRSLYDWVQRPAPLGVEAAHLCLGDKRLRGQNPFKEGFKLPHKKQRKRPSSGGRVGL